MIISYAITVCNELEELKALLGFLRVNKRKEDEVVVLVDTSDEKSTYVLDYLKTLDFVETFSDRFENDFASWKNKLSTICKGDYIFQIDADELPKKELIDNLPLILENNNIDLYCVPRINLVEGITQEHIRKWNWTIDSSQRINFPDYQTRIYRRSENIRWSGKVHEQLTGAKTYTLIPAEDQYCLVHKKSIDRQERQNNYYLSTFQ